MRFLIKGIFYVILAVIFAILSVYNITVGGLAACFLFFVFTAIGNKLSEAWEKKHQDKNE